MRIPPAPAYVTTRAPIHGPLPTWHERIYPHSSLTRAMRHADRLKREGVGRVRVVTSRPPARRYLVQTIEREEMSR